MRPSDLVDADLEGTASDLAALETEGLVAKQPAGRDAIWRAGASAAARPEAA